MSLPAEVRSFNIGNWDKAARKWTFTQSVDAYSLLYHTSFDSKGLVLLHVNKSQLWREIVYKILVLIFRIYLK